MNNVNRNRILENRFDADAVQGFNLVHDSNDFFNKIKSPFKTEPKKASLSNWGFIYLELLVAIALLLTAKLIDVSTDSSEFAFSTKPVKIAENKIQDLTDEKFVIVADKNLEIKDKKIKKGNQILPSTLSNSLPIDTTSTLFVLTVNGAIEKVDSIIIRDPSFAYLYSDHKSKYNLRYVENLLIVDYTDTVFTGVKLAPLLTGVPALYENEKSIVNANIPKNEINTFVKTDDYLKSIERPLRNLNLKKYETSIKGFTAVLIENPNDQNALFYCGLAYFNLGDYSLAIASFEKVKQLNNSVFEEDADWMIAKVYEALGQNEYENKLLKTIASSNSFYRSQAIEALKHK